MNKFGSRPSEINWAADAAILPNAAADSLIQCDYSAARLIENPSEEASVFPQDVPACGGLDGGANDETKEVAVDASVNVSAAISQSVEVAKVPAVYNP